MNRQLKKDMEEQVGGALTGNYGKMTVFKSFMAIVILLLGVIDVCSYLIGFSANIPAPFSFDDVVMGEFTYRLDDDGTRHELSQLCEVQKAGFILTTGMLVWFVYAAIFSFTWRVKSWYNREQITAYERRVESVMEQYMASGQFASAEENHGIRAPPAWAADDEEWWKWIEESKLAVTNLTNLLTDSNIKKYQEKPTQPGKANANPAKVNDLP